MAAGQPRRTRVRHRVVDLPRLAQLIEEAFAIRCNPGWLSARLRDRGFTPQKTERVPRELDPGAITAWLASDWLRVKKKARRRGGQDRQAR